MIFEKRPGDNKAVVRVGCPLPNFSGTIVTYDNKFADFSLRDLKKKYVVLVFFPLAFTFVCPTELIAINNRLPEFDSRGAEVVAIGIDSHHALLQWKTMAAHQGGIGDVQYPLFSDLTRRVSRAYGVVFDESTDAEDDVASCTGSAVPLRGTFIADRDGVLQHFSVNNLGIGRNFDETLRLLDAIQFNEKYGEVCPAGWNRGKEGMRPNKDGVVDYLTSNAERL